MLRNEPISAIRTKQKQVLPERLPLLRDNARPHKAARNPCALKSLKRKKFSNTLSLFLS